MPTWLDEVKIATRSSGRNAVEMYRQAASRGCWTAPKSTCRSSKYSATKRCGTGGGGGRHGRGWRVRRHWSRRCHRLRRGRFRRGGFRRETRDVLRLAAVEQAEVLFAEASHRAALRIAHHHLYRHQVGLHADLKRRRRLVRANLRRIG